MDFGLSSREQAFRDELRAFLAEHMPTEPVLPIMFVAIDFADPALQDAWRAMAVKLGEQGLLSLCWPTEWGGRAATRVEEFILVEELLYAGGLGFDVQGAGMVATLLLHHGTTEQKERHLPGIREGRTFWCQGFSEPDSGSDLASLTTRAVRDGDDYVISGTKVWTSRADQAHWCHLLARTDPDAPKHKGLSYFLVDMSTPGIEVRPFEGLYGGHSLCQVFLDKVAVPAANRVGAENDAWKVALSVLEQERAFYMEQVGTGRRVLELLVEHARATGKNRDPHVRRALARMATQLQVARLLGYRTAAMMDKGKPVPGEGSMCKLVATEWAVGWARTGMELLGLYGPLHESDPLALLHGRIQHWYSRSFALPVVAGTSEIERTILATRGLGLPR